MTQDEFVLKALDVPFVTHGRSWEAWDCFGLVRLFYREVMGIDLPLYDIGYETAGETEEDRINIASLIDENRPHWIQTDKPDCGCVLLLRVHGQPVHVGVMVDRSRFLHTEKRIGTMIERVASPMWAKRIEGIYRYAAN